MPEEPENMDHDFQAQPPRPENITVVDIEDELRRSYLGYAVSTLIARALPDARDGLKPVQRRILMAMHDLNLTPAAQHRKSAKICGDTSGNYHPHGEAVVYPTLVRMAQDFSLRYPLVDGQGNFGSIDGDPPAAMRYTEARMAVFATEMLVDLDRDTVDWMPNYDQSRMEPSVLPSRFPNLLCNGSEGIAVGMTTKIPPHNLREICDACCYMLDHPDASVDDLMKFVPGPDFPTAGLILGTRGIREAYATGRGRVVIQANVQIEQVEGGRYAIVISELPYQVNKQLLQDSIAELVRSRKITDIADMHDYTDRHGIRVVITLKRDAQPRRVLNYLLKHTALRTTFGVILLALVNNQPKLLTLPDMIRIYLDHRRTIVYRRTLYELGRAKARAHILEGLQIALDFIDEIIRIIRQSDNDQIARNSLMERFGLTQLQATAILDTQLRQLTRLNRERIETEYRSKLREIGSYEDILIHPERVDAIIKQELRTLHDKYGDDRRTRIVPTEPEEIGEEDVIPQEDMVITVTRNGYVKRVPMDSYRTQKRGGRGVIGASTRVEDRVEHLFVANTHDYLLFFTNRGRVYKLKTYEIPQCSRTAMGTAIVNLIAIEPGDVITASVPVRDLQSASGYMLMATRNGEVKRVSVSEFANLRANGLICFDLEPDDELRWVMFTDGNREVVMVTRNGKSIRFHETDVPVRGRPAGGVRGIELRDADRNIVDQVVAVDLVDDTKDLLVVGERGIGKRSPLTHYRRQSRGGVGIKTMEVTEKTGPVIAACVVSPEDRLMMITKNGIAIQLPVRDIRRAGRSTQGVRLHRVEPDDSVATIERICNETAAKQEPQGAVTDAPVNGE